MEMFLRPPGRSESEFFQTWVTDSDFEVGVISAVEGIENYRSPEDLRLRLREKAREKQSQHIP